MAYATSADMVARFGEAEMIRLTAAEGELSGPVDTDAVALALADAASMVDSYVQRRFLTPLNPVPPSIAAATCNLARHALAMARNQSPTEAMTRARDEATAWLKRIASGEATLPGATASTLGGGARLQDRDPMWLRETTGGGNLPYTAGLY